MDTPVTAITHTGTADCRVRPLHAPCYTGTDAYGPPLAAMTVMSLLTAWRHQVRGTPAQPPAGMTEAGLSWGRVTLDQDSTRNVLRILGYGEGAIRQAVEHAPFTTPQDPPSFLARHTVVSTDGTEYRIIDHDAGVPDDVASAVAARLTDLTREYDVSEILAAIRVVDAHLDAAAPAAYRDNPLANMWRRIAAGPVSESVEASDALNLATGGNPRKGVVGTYDDVLSELGDTASSALLAIQSITKDTDVTWAVFTAALAKALSRVPQPRPAPAPSPAPAITITKEDPS